MKLLLVPWGRGMGHLIPCLAVGMEAAKHGNQAYVVAEDKYANLIKQSSCTIVSYPSELTSEGIWEKWDQADHVQRFLSADLQLLKTIKPNVVLHDSRPTVQIACEIAGVPCAMLAQSRLCPEFLFPGALEPDPVWRKTAPAINMLLRKYGLQPLIKDTRELFLRNPFLMRSIPEFDPWYGDLTGAQVWYTGPLLVHDIGTSAIPKLAEISLSRTIYVYGVIQTQQDLDQLITEFRDGPYQLLLTGLPSAVHFSPAEIRNTNINIYPFIDAHKILPQCAAAIIHGGHGSSMALLSTATPGVVLSGLNEPERALNGKRLESMGVALHTEGEISWKAVKNLVRTIIEVPSYRRNAQQWQRHMKQFKGPETCWKILTRLASGVTGDFVLDVPH